MNKNAYWIGKCRHCHYVSEYQLRPWLYWDCDYYKIPMYKVKSCDSPKVKLSENRKLDLEIKPKDL